MRCVHGDARVVSQSVVLSVAQSERVIPSHSAHKQSERRERERHGGNRARQAAAQLATNPCKRPYLGTGPDAFGGGYLA